MNTFAFVLIVSILHHHECVHLSEGGPQWELNPSHKQYTNAIAVELEGTNDEDTMIVQINLINLTKLSGGKKEWKTFGDDEQGSEFEHGLGEGFRLPAVQCLPHQLHHQPAEVRMTPHHLGEVDHPRDLRGTRERTE